VGHVCTLHGAHHVAHQVSRFLRDKHGCAHALVLGRFRGGRERSSTCPIKIPCMKEVSVEAFCVFVCLCVCACVCVCVCECVCEREREREKQSGFFWYSVQALGEFVVGKIVVGKKKLVPVNYITQLFGGHNNYGSECLFSLALFSRGYKNVSSITPPCTFQDRLYNFKMERHTYTPNKRRTRRTHTHTVSEWTVPSAVIGCKFKIRVELLIRVVYKPGLCYPDYKFTSILCILCSTTTCSDSASDKLSALGNSISLVCLDRVGWGFAVK